KLKTPYAAGPSSAQCTWPSAGFGGTLSDPDDRGLGGLRRDGLHRRVRVLAVLVLVPELLGGFNVHHEDEKVVCLVDGRAEVDLAHPPLRYEAVAVGANVGDVPGRVGRSGAVRGEQQRLGGVDVGEPGDLLTPVDQVAVGEIGDCYSPGRQ